MKPRTLIMGASTRPDRYSNLVANLMIEKGLPVYLFGNKKGEIQGHQISNNFPTENIDTVTLYMGRKNQGPFIEKILALKPRRIIFNPGAENEDFFIAAENEGIECENACTLVLLKTNQYL